MDSGYQEARNGAAFDERRDRGRVLLTGADTTAFLQGILTNDIASLAPGTGCYAALLTPQGRMITDMDVLSVATHRGNGHLLLVPSDVAGPLAARLDKFIFSEDVAVWDVSPMTAHFSVVGPGAGAAADAAVSALGHDAVSSRLMKAFDNVEVRLGDEGAVIARSDEVALAAFDLMVPAKYADAVRAALGAHAVALSAEARETLRVEAGRAKFHVDMTGDTIPLEANLLDRAISTTKGCYVGQEVIIRVLHRGGGRVAKRLARLRFDADAAHVPHAGDLLSDEEREVGRVTSAVWSPHEAAAIGLGYVHRDFALEGETLSVSSGGSATITSV